MNFLQRTPFFRLLVSLITGIVTARYLVLFTPTLISLASLSLVAIVASLLLRNSSNQFRIRWMFGLGLMVILFLTGYQLAVFKEKSTRFNSSVQSDYWVAVINSTPEIKEKSVACAVTLMRVPDTSRIFCKGKKVLLYIRKDTASMNLVKGDVIMFQSVLQAPGKPLNPKGFDYAQWLRRKGIAATGFVDSLRWRQVHHIESFSIRDYAENNRKKLLSLYEAYFHGKNEFAVLAALTLGYKEAIDPELRESYSHSGAMHILAVSGLHVGVIYLVLNWLLSLVFRGRKAGVLKVAFVVILLWLYAFITGLPPSVIRSATMFSLVAIGAALERKSQIYNTISVSAFLILISEPDYIYDIGFQLSYAAVISIVYFQPYIAGLHGSRSRVICWLRDLAAVSLAAQIGTLPLAIYYFNQFPNYFLLTNFVAIPLATLIIYASVAFISLSCIPILASGIAFVLNWLLKALNASVAWIQQIPGSVSGFYIDDIQLWLMVLLILGIVFYIETRKFWSVMVVMISVLCFICVDFYQIYHNRKKHSLVVYADRAATHLSLIQGRSHMLITTDSLSAEKTAKSYWKSRRLNYTETYGVTDNFCTMFHDKKILVLQNEMLRRMQTDKSLQVDYLILGNGIATPPGDIFKTITPRVIIADLTIPAWYAQRMADSCQVRDITFYYLKDHGAYLSDFHVLKR